MGCREGCGLGCLGVLIGIVTANPLIGAIVFVGGYVAARLSRRRRVS
jgi:hypothetical protein